MVTFLDDVARASIEKLLIVIVPDAEKNFTVFFDDARLEVGKLSAGRKFDKQKIVNHFKVDTFLERLAI